MSISARAGVPVVSSWIGGSRNGTWARKSIAYCYTGSALEEVRNGELAVAGTSIRVSPDEMFAELDRA
jgi:hypothetical protein